MAVNATRNIQLGFTGDVNAPNMNYSAADNATGSGQNELIDLVSGANTITPPSGAKAVTIIPPAENLETITLKGLTGDTGVVLHLTDPSSIGLNNAATTFVLTASDDITGVRLIWS